eukprot:499721_1
MDVTDIEIWDLIFHDLPLDPICHIFSFLTFYELSLCSIISLEWHHIISTNNLLWFNLCQSYWSNKTYIPPQYRKLLKTNIKSQSVPAHNHKLSSECIARKAFRLAYLDRKRITLTIDELTQFRWYFRFKEQAGQTWLDIDPFWNINLTQNDSDTNHSDDENININMMEYNYKPSELVGILTDDEIEEYKLKQLKYEQLIRQNNKKILTEHETRLLRCTRIQFNRNNTMEFQQNRYMSNMVNTQQFRWRFCGGFCRETLFGDGVQVNSYPKKYVSRHPIHWGWIMQSCWVIYTSFPMPNIHSDDDMLINNDDFGVRGYAEMISRNGMNGNSNEEEDKWRVDGDMFDLEYLKEVKNSISEDVEDGNNLEENDVGLQYAIAQFLQRYTG